MVSTPLKNISQNGNLPQVGVKIKNIWNHHLDIVSWKNSFNFWDQQCVIQNPLRSQGANKDANDREDPCVFWWLQPNEWQTWAGAKPLQWKVQCHVCSLQFEGRTLAVLERVLSLRNLPLVSVVCHLYGFKRFVQIMGAVCILHNKYLYNLFYTVLQWVSHAAIPVC